MGCVPALGLLFSFCFGCSDGSDQSKMSSASGVAAGAAGSSGSSSKICVGPDGYLYAVGSSFRFDCHTCECQNHESITCTRETCGNPCALGCASTEYCAVDPATCDRKGGVCVVRPDVCSDMYRPVCSCGNVTFPNECFAAMSGATVVSDGECPGK